MPNEWIGSSQGLCIDGVNSSVRPDLIGQNQVAWMVNGTVRDGKARTRIGLVERLALPGGKVQGAGFYSTYGGKLILSIGGHLYRVLIQGDNFSYEEITLGFLNSSILDDAWMVETPSGFIVQDNQSAAIIYNGSVARRADSTQKEVPIGSAMAFGNGRLWVVNKGGRNLVAGDIYDGSTGSEWKFTETQYLLGGGAFYFPYQLTGLGFLPVNNTTTGYGSLMVFGARSLVSLRAEVTARDLWQIIPGFQTIVLDGIGTPSHHSITRVDQDLYWRDESGQIRSVRSAAQEAQGPGNTGLSREIDRIVDFETDAWLSKASGVYVNNRLLFTAAPLISTGTPQNIGFQKLISLDCSPLASMRGKAQPAYDGEWTGVNIVRMVQGTFRGKKRAFAIVRDGTSNSLWEFDDGRREDSYLADSTPTPVRIQSAVEYRRFDFGLPSSPKQLTRCDVYPSQIEGDVDISVYWRVQNRNQWLLWGSFNACAKMDDPAETTNGPDQLLVDPNDFSTNAWTKPNVTVEGAIGAQVVKEVVTVGAVQHGVFQRVFMVAGRTYQFSFRVKKFATRFKIVTYLYDGPLGGASGLKGIFNLTAGTGGINTDGGITDPDFAITDEGDGWWLLMIKATFPIDSNEAFCKVLFSDDGGAIAYIGDDTEGYYLKDAGVTDFMPGYPEHVWKNLRSQERGRVKSLTIPSLKDAIMQLAQSAGYSFQIRLVWQGNVTIDRIDIFARTLTDKAFSDVFNLPDACVQNEVAGNEILYSIVP